MDYIDRITDFVKQQMKVKTKLHEKDIEAYIKKLVKNDNPDLDIRYIERHSYDVWNFYKSENAELKSLDKNNDDGYLFFPPTGDVAIFKNVWTNFLQRQKTRRDSKGRYVRLPNEKNEIVKIYI